MEKCKQLGYVGNVRKIRGIRDRGKRNAIAQNILIAFFNTLSASWVSLSCFLRWAISLACIAGIVAGSSCDDLIAVIFIAFESPSNGRIVDFELLRDLGIGKVRMIEHVLDHLFLKFFVILFCHFSFLLILEFKLFFL